MRKVMFDMPWVKLLSVNILRAGKEELECNGSTLKEIIEELEEKLPGVKDELLYMGKLSQVYSFVLESSEERVNKNIKNLSDRIEKNGRITIFPVITGG
jgi:molybdopterin converting factor small subunit